MDQTNGGVLKMSYQPLEDLLPRSGKSIYKLVRMAANRAMELAEGQPKMVKEAPTDKLTTIALEEIKQGKLMLKEVADRIAAQEKKQKKS